MRSKPSFLSARNSGAMVKLTHAAMTRMMRMCTSSSQPPPPMNSPYGRSDPPKIFSAYSLRVNSAVKRTPHAPHPPCSCAASSGSSNLNLVASALRPMNTYAETNLQMMAAHGSTTEQPVVLVAKPPRRPLQTSTTF
ncbi:hypothetical protein ABZP36_004185 [Zizania latifolia]